MTAASPSVPPPPKNTPRSGIYRLGRVLLKILTLLLILLLGALLLLNFWFVPRIDLYRPQIEQIIARHLGTPAHIGHISAQRNGILPTIQIADIRLDAPDHTPGLSIKNIQAALSFWALLKLDLQFTQLHINQPVIKIERNQDGSLFIAGIDISRFTGGPQTGQIPGSMLWLLRQPRIEIHQGQIFWSDQTIDASDIPLHALELLIQAQGNSHTIQIQATPPTSWGERFTLKLHLTEPAFASPKDYTNWQAEAYAHFPWVDIQQLPDYIQLPITIEQGRGYLEAVGRYQQGQLIESRATFNLPEVQIQAAPELAYIHLQNFNGTITGTWQPNAYRIQTDDLTFQTAPQTLANGAHIPEQTWPTSQLDIRWQYNDENKLNGGGLKTGPVSLNLLAQLAQKLPLPEQAQNLLAQINPQGRIEFLELQWEGLPSQPQTYSAKGKIQDLIVTAGERMPPAPGKRIRVSRPGFEHLNLSFDFNENQGSAWIGLENGTVTLPGLYEDNLATISVNHALADIQWQRLPNGQYQFEVPNFNALAPGGELQLQIQWKSPDPQDPLDTAGHFQLTGKLLNGNATYVSRYLPVSIQPKARDYVHAALISGHVPEARVHIEGPLVDFPYHKNETGIFLIEGQAVDVTYDFAPAVARKPGQGPWPLLEHVNGHARFTSKGMHITNARGQILGAPGIQLAVDSVTIPDWGNNDTHVLVSGNITGPASQILQTINTTAPGKELLNNMLASAQATGQLNGKLELDITVDHMPDSKASGHVIFNGNTISLWPFTPQIQQAQATLFFTEQGFHIPQLQGQSLGGHVQGQAQWQRNRGLQMRLNGNFTAQGLFTDPQWSARLFPELRWATGTASYTFTADIENKQQVMYFQSDLQGLDIILPEPFAKTAQEPYPLHIKLTPLPPAHQNRYLPLSIELNTPAGPDQLPRIRANYIIDYTPTGVNITQGAIGVNTEPVMPLTGTAARIRLDYLSIPNWKTLLSALPAPQHPSAATSQASNPVLPAWWPNHTVADIQTLSIGQTLLTHDTHLQIQRNNQSWTAQINSDEIIGQLEWKAATPASHATDTNGLLRTRFSRLWLPAFGTSNNKQNTKTPGTQPYAPNLFTLLPDTEILVSDLRFGQAKIGQFTLNAHIDKTVVPARWQIDTLRLNNAQAELQAQGYWADTPVPTTSLQFTLEAPSTEQVMAQLGYSNILAETPASLQGELSWQGLPYALDIRTLRGQINASLGKGRFLPVEPGAGRLISLLGLQTLPNRLMLDFRDIFSNGWAFDQVHGYFVINHGTLSVNTLELESVNASIITTGTINLLEQTQNLKIIIEPQVNAGIASLALIAVNPAVGLGTLAAQMALQEPLRKIATHTYYVTGLWDNPEISQTVPRQTNIADKPFRK